MTVAEILDANRGPHGWDRSRAEAAINAALELAAQRIEARIGSLAVSRDRANAAGRETVALCRQSDMETCERMAAEVRALKSPAGPVQPSQDQEKSGA